MENHLERMQANVDAMEQMISNPVEESAPTNKAHTDPTNTLDGMIENDKDVVKEKEVVVGEVSKKIKRNDWKSRYTKYKTATDATIFELRKENSNLISQVQALNIRLDEARVSTEDTTQFSDRFSDVDKEIFGEDALSSLEDATNAAVEPLKKQLAEEKEWREKQLELQRVKSQQEANTYFLTALANAVPDYVNIDTDPAFKKWIDQPDTLSGVSRVKLFKQAEHAGDVSRIANFMNEFKEANKPIDNLKDKVSPVTTSAASPTYDREGQISMRDVHNFYDDVLKGRYRGNETKRVEMDTKINKALADGNVY